MLLEVLKEMRIKQWTKNLFVYAAILFHGDFFNLGSLLPVTIIFFAFSFTASGIYFFNDICDMEKDKKNPKKSLRPVAAGKISKNLGYFFSGFFIFIGLLIACKINFLCAEIIFSYVILNLLYSKKLKNFVIVDVLIISYGFVIRTVLGTIVTDIPMTIWFILCVMFLSLFLALCKRRYDILNSSVEKKFLHVDFLDKLINIVTATLIICYSLFAVNSEKSETIFSIPLVLYGIFHYLYIVTVKQEGGSPDEILYKEKPILFTVLIYILFIIFTRNVN